MDHTLRRSGQAPLRFSGELIAEESSHQSTGGGALQYRWHEAAIYQAGRKYVLAISYRTVWQSEHDRDDAFVFDSPQEVGDALRDHDPLCAVNGFPPGEAYAEKQKRLESAIRDGYAAMVSRLLEDERFAVGLEQAEHEQYVQLDLQAVGEFVVAQLAGFHLTRGEACALCDANNGAMLFPEGCCWPGIGANIFDFPASSLSEKWRCDAAALASRINAADRGTQFALAWAAAQFWRHCDKDTDEALRLAGFAIREATS